MLTKRLLRIVPVQDGDWSIWRNRNQQTVDNGWTSVLHHCSYHISNSNKPWDDFIKGCSLGTKLVVIEKLVRHLSYWFELLKYVEIWPEGNALFSVRKRIHEILKEWKTNRLEVICHHTSLLCRSSVGACFFWMNSFYLETFFRSAYSTLSVIHAKTALLSIVYSNHT